MVDPGKIQGKKISELFEQLIASKTIISLRVVGSDFERLTCVVAVKEDPFGTQLIVDFPDGFKEAIAKFSTWRLNFSFNGQDRLEYVFSTLGGEYCPQGLRLPFPEFIERLQRRKNFRMIAPVGARMLITTPIMKGFINLINISLGGAYGVLGKHNLKNAHGSILTAKQSLEKIGIIFPADSEIAEQVVVIKRGEVRRVEHDLGRNRYKYAFEFMEIEPDQLRNLTQYIYHLQRQFLKRR